VALLTAFYEYQIIAFKKADGCVSSYIKLRADNKRKMLKKSAILNTAKVFLHLHFTGYRGGRNAQHWLYFGYLRVNIVRRISPSRVHTTPEKHNSHVFAFLYECALPGA
jgi:hypothetical protein